MREGKWIRWMGAIAALVAMSVFVFNRGVRSYSMGSERDAADVLVHLVLLVLPTFAAVFLCAFARFWWAFSLGLWLAIFSLMNCVDEGGTPASLVLVLAVVTICMTPILNRAYRAKRPGTGKDAQPTDSYD